MSRSADAHIDQMNQAHSPAPWTLDHEAPRWVDSKDHPGGGFMSWTPSIRAGGFTIGQASAFVGVLCGTHLQSIPEAKANGSLMVAAPDMLAALEEVVRTLERPAIGESIHPHDASVAACAARAAIAKAKGEPCPSG